MSKKTDLFEQQISDCASNSSKLPNTLPQWIINLGIKPNSCITSSNKIGSKDAKNKTDILIKLKNSNSIKISAKLSSADYFGNWYGHKRFIKEFGIDKFNKLSLAITNWANNWITKPQASPFVGVSICFGKRSGETAIPFLDIFSPDDIISIVRGYGEECDSTANCMYISDTPPSTIDELISNLKPINHESIIKVTGEFMIACRPINPMTEYSNRGKNVYTKFIPFKALDEPTILTTTEELHSYGSFFTIEPNSLNHNHILNELESKYNIIIPRKKRC